MRRLFLYVGVVVLFNSFITSSRADVVVSEEGHAALAEARRWVLAEDVEMDDWSPQEVLGAVELIHWTSAKLGESETKFVGKAVLHLLEQGGPEEDPNKVRGLLILLLTMEDRGNDNYYDFAKYLLKIDSGNAVAWMLLGESAWLRGEFQQFAIACQQVRAAKVATLHAQDYRRHIASILEKAGQDSIEAKREFLLTPMPMRIYAMFLRHITLLESVSLVSRFVGFSKEDYEHLVLRYLALSTLSMPVGFGFDLHAITQSAFRHSQLTNPSIESLFEKQRKVLTGEVVQAGSVAGFGTAEEVDQLIQEPDRIREKVLGAFKKEADSLEASEWLTAIPTKKPIAGGFPAESFEDDPLIKGLCSQCGMGVPKEMSECYFCGRPFAEQD